MGHGLEGVADAGGSVGWGNALSAKRSLYRGRFLLVDSRRDTRVCRTEGCDEGGAGERERELVNE